MFLCTVCVSAAVSSSFLGTKSGCRFNVVALEPFEVVDLVGRVLIDDEEVVAQGAEDETEVELTDDSHVAKVLAAKHPLELAGGNLVAPLVQRGAQATLLAFTAVARSFTDAPRVPSRRRFTRASR